MIRHIEFEIKSDLTCYSNYAEDFENDTDESIQESVEDWAYHNSDELLKDLKIKRVWYEED